MVLATAYSKNNIPIRLTEERWQHITLSHQEVDTNDITSITKTVENPDTILKGDTGELLAVKKKVGKKMWIVVAYKEVTAKDGFIITAYLTTDNRWLFQRKVLWNKA